VLSINAPREPNSRKAMQFQFDLVAKSRPDG